MSSIKKFLFNNMLFITVVSFVCFYFLGVLNEYTKFTKESVSVKENFIASEKERLKGEVQNVLEYVQYMKKQTEKRLQDSIKMRVNEACGIALNIYNENKDSKSRDQIKKMIKDSLRPIRFNQSRGYYFAFNMEGIEELFADRPELEGKNMLAVQGAMGEYVVPDMIEIIKTRKEGFYSYTWSKPGDPNTQCRKISYIKFFEPLGWGIGTGEYIEDVEQEIQQEVLERISKIRFRKEGYFFGSTYRGDSLFTNGKIVSEEKNIWELTDPKGVKIIQEQNKAVKKAEGGFVSYSWQKMNSDKISPKLSYVVGIPEWEWLIGAGVYLDTMDEIILSKETVLYQDFIKQAVLFFAVMLLIFFLSFLWTKYQAKKVQDRVALFLNFFKTASSQSTSISTVGLKFEEFKSIAISANKMIEARTEALQALQDSEEKFRMAFFSSPDSINIKRAKDGVYLEINEGFTNIIGYSRKETIGISSLDLNIWHDPKDRDFLLAGLKKNGLVENLEATFIGKEGRKIIGLISAQILNIGNEEVILSIMRDVTERKRMQKDREQHLAVIEQLAEGVVITDTNANIEYVNPAFEKITGYSKQELIGKNPRILKSGEYDEFFYRKMWKTIMAGDIWIGRLINKKKNGKSYTEDTTISPVFDKSGKIINFVAVKRDVTDEIRLEKKIRQSQKMESIGILAGGIAHDFNNILSAIIGFTELALGAAEKGTELEDDLQEIRKASLRAKDIVKQILTFARKSDEKVKPIQVSAITREVLKLIKASIPATIQIKDNIDSDSLTMGSPSQVHQIFMNLFTNATQAMEKNGGILGISINDTIIDKIIIPGLKSGKYILIKVTDTGIGIPTQNTQAIFEPYFTTKSVDKGTGLGLAVVHGIVEEYGGKITIDSTIDKGTCITIYLPITKKRKLHTSLEKKNLLHGNGNENILFVDDEASIAKMGLKILEQVGYSVTTRTSSIEALELFKKKPQEFDLIITDMTMPKMTGDMMAKEIINIRSDIPVILCTGYSKKISEEHAMKIGIKAFAYKPIVKADLIKTVRKVLDETNSSE